VAGTVHAASVKLFFGMFDHTDIKEVSDGLCT